MKVAKFIESSTISQNFAKISKPISSYARLKKSLPGPLRSITSKNDKLPENENIRILY